MYLSPMVWPLFFTGISSKVELDWNDKPCLISKVQTRGYFVDCLLPCLADGRDVGYVLLVHRAKPSFEGSDLSHSESFKSEILRARRFGKSRHVAHPQRFTWKIAANKLVSQVFERVLTYRAWIVGKMETFRKQVLNLKVLHRKVSNHTVPSSLRAFSSAILCTVFIG